VTAEELDLLKRAEGYVLAVELVGGEQFFAEVQIVVDVPPTPDVFLLRVEREQDGAFVAASESGESVLLSDISRVAGIPGVAYPEEAKASAS
jgi:hypothetical protein